MSTTDHIPKAVRRAREAHALTQAALAEAAETTAETVSRVERGTLEPSASLLARLAIALDTSMDALAGLTTSEPAKRRATQPEVKRLMRRLKRLSPAAVRRIAAVVELIEPAASRANGKD